MLPAQNSICTNYGYCYIFFILYELDLKNLDCLEFDC